MLFCGLSHPPKRLSLLPGAGNQETKIQLPAIGGPPHPKALLGDPELAGASLSATWGVNSTQLRDQIPAGKKKTTKPGNSCLSPQTAF